MNVDVIGDVHGQYDKLVALLSSLGYQQSAGAWRHSERTAIFVGDLIDRGPKQVATVDLIRRMVEEGTARCILGNHEFNAVSWVTPDPALPGEYLRRHTREHWNQHRAFLEQVAHEGAHENILAWFKTLPLWMDLGTLRIVHACWHQPSMEDLRPVLGPGHTLSEEAIVLGNQKGHPIHKAIEVVCKGPELPLPPGLAFKDKDGKMRREVRMRWWERELRTYRESAIVSPGDEALVPELRLPPAAQTYFYQGAAVVFGHYWFTGPPGVISKDFACVDYSAAQSGPLVAYRWDGEADLSTDKLAWVSTTRQRVPRL